MVAQSSDGQSGCPIGIHSRVDKTSAFAELTFDAIARAADIKLSVYSDQAHDRHFILGEGSRLVGTYDGGTAQRLHGRQTPNDTPPADHALHTYSQGDSDHGRQAFRYSRYGQADSREEHLIHRQALDDSGGKDQSDQSQTHTDQYFAQVLQSDLQRCGTFVCVLDETGDLSDLGVHARGHNDTPTTTPDSRGAHEKDILTVTGTFGSPPDPRRAFRYGQRFSGEWAFIGSQ